MIQALLLMHINCNVSIVTLMPQEGFGVLRDNLLTIMVSVKDYSFFK